MTDEKTELEKAAETWADIRCPEQGQEHIVWCMCKEDFLKGAQEGKLWLLAQLEQAFPDPGPHGAPSMEWVGRQKQRIEMIKKARELCK